MNVIREENLCKFVKIFDETIYVERSGAVYRCRQYNGGMIRWYLAKPHTTTAGVCRGFCFVDSSNCKTRYIHLNRIMNHVFHGFSENELYKFKYDD